jgi:hypothetical protein
MCSCREALPRKSCTSTSLEAHLLSDCQAILRNEGVIHNISMSHSGGERPKADVFSRMPAVALPNAATACFGLTSQPVRLSQIRQERRPGSNYASLHQCTFELRNAEDMYGSTTSPTSTPQPCQSKKSPPPSSNACNYTTRQAHGVLRLMREAGFLQASPSAISTAIT